MKHTKARQKHLTIESWAKTLCINNAPLRFATQNVDLILSNGHTNSSNSVMYALYIYIYIFENIYDGSCQVSNSQTRVSSVQGLVPQRQCCHCTWHDMTLETNHRGSKLNHSIILHKDSEVKELAIFIVLTRLAFAS